MALTVNIRERTTFGRLRANVVDVTFDNSYPTGGEDLTPAQLGLSNVHVVTSDGVGGRTFPYDRAAKKLMAFASTTQVTNATDLSAVTTRLVVIGQ